VRLPLIQRAFFYMPYQHAENRTLQRESVAPLRSTGADGVRAPSGCAGRFYQSAEQHQALIERFGRFPHRNSPLKRTSSEAEKAFLANNEQTFGQ